MLMDINTLATIQQDRHQELMRLAAQQRLVQTEKRNSLSDKERHGTQQPAHHLTWQERLFAVFQMRIRTVLPR